MAPRPGGVAMAAIVSAAVVMARDYRADCRVSRFAQRLFAAAAAASFSSNRFMCHCWKIWMQLLTSQ